MNTADLRRARAIAERAAATLALALEEERAEGAPAAAARAAVAAADLRRAAYLAEREERAKRDAHRLRPSSAAFVIADARRSSRWALDAIDAAERDAAAADAAEALRILDDADAPSDADAALAERALDAALAAIAAEVDPSGDADLGALVERADHRERDLADLLGLALLDLVQAARRAANRA